MICDGLSEKAENKSTDNKGCFLAMYTDKVGAFRAFPKGTVAEWLGRGLQNLLQRFESAQCLQ